MRVAIQDHYSKIKTIARQLGCRDSLYVIWAYSQYLQADNFGIPADIEVAPVLLNTNPPQTILAEWTLELMAREIIRYAEEEPRRGCSLRRWNRLAEMANAFRNLDGDIYKTLVGAGHIHLELMRISHREFVWQQNSFNWVPVIRFYKLFNTPEIVTHLQQATGLTLKQIYLIGMFYLANFFQRPLAARQLNIQIPNLTQEHIDRFLAFTSLRKNFLANRLRTEHALDEGFFYRYSSLREFPLVQISYCGRDEIACPVPTLLFWRITSGLYYTAMSQNGFLTAFGASFQRYVGEVLYQRITNQQIRVLEEQQFYASRDRKDTVDWIIEQGNECALFIECKTKRLTWASKAGLADLSALEKDIRVLAQAVVQVYKTIADYRKGLYPHFAFTKGRHIYVAVVTLEDWYFFGGELPQRLDLAIREIMGKVGLPTAWLEEMPYVILSIDELEKTFGIFNDLGIDKVFSGKVEDPEFKRWAFKAYCQNQFRDELVKQKPLFQNEFDQLFVDIQLQSHPS